jgi:hypothetical protein
MWPIAESLIKRNGPKTPITILGPLGIIYRPKEKDNATAERIENQFTCHDPCEGNLE